MRADNKKVVKSSINPIHNDLLNIYVETEKRRNIKIWVIVKLLPAVVCDWKM